MRTPIVVGLALALVLSAGACHKDFDGLFANEDQAVDNGSSGGGKSCECPPCSGPSCGLKCPPGCDTCICSFVCTSPNCDVTCGERTVCTIASKPGTSTNVTCAAGAGCACSGDCTIATCSTGKIVTCNDGGGSSCNTKCVE